MFGFVNVYKNELKIKDYERFRAYYCGLCKSLGRRYNQLVRLGLSYDMTFLSILADSLSDTVPDIKKTGCIKKRGKMSVCSDNKAIDYCADASVILTYHKLCDDIKDSCSAKALVGKIPYFFAYKKACKSHPELAKNISHNLTRLSSLENEKCDNIDIVADPFATLTGEIFKGWDESLYHIGYNIGRLIYILDAYKDIQEDINNKNYNPFVCMYGITDVQSDEVKIRAMGSLNMTLTAISDEYRNLPIKKNKAILDNIIYLGLRVEYDKTFLVNGGQ